MSNNNNTYLLQELAETTAEIASREEIIAAIQILGLSIYSGSDGRNYVKGTITNPYLNNGKEADALLVVSSLAEVKSQVGKSFEEIAQTLTDKIASEQQEISELNSDKVEFELGEDEQPTFTNAREQVLKQIAGENRKIGDLDGAAAEADLIIQIFQGRQRAWQNPQTRQKLTELIQLCSGAGNIAKKKKDGQIIIPSLRQQIAQKTNNKVLASTPTIKSATALLPEKNYDEKLAEKTTSLSHRSERNTHNNNGKS